MSLGRNPSLRRLSSGIGSQGVGLVLLTAANLLAVPVLLHAWGTEQYGHWIMAMSAATLLNLLDCGLHGYFSNRIRHSWNCGATDDAQRTFRVGLALYAAPVVAAAAIAALVTALDLAPSPFPWLAAAVIVVIPRGIISGILSASGRFGTEVWLFQAGMIGAAMAVMAAAGGLGLGPDHAAIVHLVAYAALSWLPLVVTIRRLYPGLDWRPTRPSPQDLRTLSRHAPLFFLPQAGTLLLQNMPIILLGRLGQPESLVLFTMLRTFTGLARQLVQQCATPIGMELANQHSRGDRQQLRAVFRLSTRLLVAIAGLACGGAMVVGPDFFRLWSAGRVAFAPWPGGFLLAAVLMTAPVAGALALIRHWHDPMPQAPGVLAQTAGGILACGLLVPMFGLNGAAFGLAAAEILASFLLLWPAAARLMETERSLAQHLGLAAAALAFSAWGAASAAAALWMVPAHGMADLIAVLGIWLALQSPAAWIGWRTAA